MGERVVVICEDEGVSEFLRLVLQSAAYEVLMARSLEEADSLMGEHPPAVAILDLPSEHPFGSDLPSLEKAALWRQQHTKVPVILLAGDLTSSAVSTARIVFDVVLPRYAPDVDRLLSSTAELVARGRPSSA